MPEYNFWADLFDTYQSTADWIKALWIVAVPGFLLGLTGVVLYFRLESKRVAGLGASNLVYTIHRDGDGALRVYQHGPDIEHRPALVLLEDPEGSRVEQQSHIGQP